MSPERHPPADEAPSVRSFWSGTITFGLVGIPVDFFTAVRSRRMSMKLVDPDGRPVGRAYECPKDGERLSSDEIVRGYETEAGRFVVITDEELESVAPEMTRDIELRRFVPLEEIPPAHFDRAYFLTPRGRSTKPYHLLAETMERTGRVGIGTFVMRGHEYLVAIIADGGILRAETLRFADELRTPEDIGLPERPEVPAERVRDMRRALAALKRDELDVEELADREADRLHALALGKKKRGQDVVAAEDADEADAGDEGGREVVDLMRLIKERLGASVAVQRAGAPPAKKAERGRETPAKAPPARAGRREDRLEALPKADLLERARVRGIPGRSKMDKAALVRALRG